MPDFTASDCGSFATARIEDQLDMLARDLAALRDSPLGKLKAMADEAAAQGKDLVRDMVGRLKRDIPVATLRRAGLHG